ncbi:MAG TPA: hypothetical protein VIJ09_05970 [Acidimicrobiales bacterium]
MTESMETTSPGRTIGSKVRTLAIGALATAALSIPAVSALSVASQHAFGKPQPIVRPQPTSRFQPISRFQPPVISPDSHRLALSLKPASVRLT